MGQSHSSQSRQSLRGNEGWEDHVGPHCRLSLGESHISEGSMD